MTSRYTGYILYAENLLKSDTDQSGCWKSTRLQLMVSYHMCVCVRVWLVHCKYITIWKQVNILNKHRTDPGRTGRRSRILWTFCCCFGFSEVFSSSFESLSRFFFFFFWGGISMNESGTLTGVCVCVCVCAQNNLIHK